MFFERLKVACVQKGTSPTTLLKKLGMSTSSVTAWKRGVSPSIGTIYRLAEALAVDPKMLLDDGQPINLEAENGACPHREGQARRGQGCGPDYE